MPNHVYACNDGCPVESTLQFISGKWKSVILYHLLDESVCHFGELQRELKDCSRRMLALQLQQLEQDNLIKKTVHQQDPLKTDYTLTDFGESLKPVILAMSTWGEKYNKQVLEQNPQLENDCRTKIE